jgi:sugar/nucleoside kinase (ribokinase family)
MKAVCIGDISVDSYLSESRSMLGGISCNVAFGLKSCGVNAILISAVGRDDEGRRILEGLRAAAIDSRYVRSLDGQSAEQIIRLEEGGERRFDGYRPGVLAKLRLAKEDESVLKNADLVHFPYSEGLESLYQELVALNLDCCCALDISVDYKDPGRVPAILESAVQYFRVVFLGGNPSYRKQMERLSRQYPSVTLVLTMGADGVEVFTGPRHRRFPAPVLTTVVDTTGCGDAFQAGFLAKFVKGIKVEDCVVNGTQQAALCAGRLGSTGIGI